MTGARGVERLGWLGLTAAIALAGVTGACESRVSLGARCAEQTECPADLFCIGGRCRSECQTSEQCGTGRRCLRGPSGVNACSTAPDDSCSSIEDCVDPLFVMCVEGWCRTACVEDAQCAGGECVQGGCAERPAADASGVAPIALGEMRAGDVVAGSFLIFDPVAPTQPLTLNSDEGFTDVAVVVEDDATGGPWVAHVATIQREGEVAGMPTLIDTEFAGSRVGRVYVELLSIDGGGASTVAAEAMESGRPAYFWTRSAPPPMADPEQSWHFGFYRYELDSLQTMAADNHAQRLLAQASIASGLGMGSDGPGWGLRVVELGLRSEYQVVGPGAGGDGVAILDFPLAQQGPIDAVGSVRATLLRHADDSVDFVRLRGDATIEHSVFPLGTSSCSPGLTGLSVGQAGNYALATCTGSTVVLRRIECPAVGAELVECVVSDWLSLPTESQPSSVALETWPGGVVLVTRDARGVHVRPISYEETSAAAVLEYASLLPSSYRVNSFLDFPLAHVASASATPRDASVAVLAGLYVDVRSRVAQIRLGVLEVSAAP